MVQEKLNYFDFCDTYCEHLGREYLFFLIQHQPICLVLSSFKLLENLHCQNSEMNEVFV